MKVIVSVSFLLTILTLQRTCHCLNKLEEKFQWNQIDFNFRDETERRNALKNRDYIPENNIPFGVEVWNKKVFITIPRRNPGVAATLNYIDLDSNTSSPLLTPYPDWDSNKPLAGHITSTYRSHADICDRLWAIDTGSVVNKRIQPPQILIFNLTTNTLIKSHQLATTSYICDTTYINIISDIRNSCEDAYAYAVDQDSNSLLVYSLLRDESWRKTHPYFNPDPFQMDYQIGDLAFQWDDGLFGFALSEINQNGDRSAFFHPMSSLCEFTVDTKLLRNSTASLTNRVKIAAVKNATFQAAAAAYDQTSRVLFYSLVNKNGIGCWNPKNQNMDIVAADDKTLVYSSDVKIDKNGNLWCITNQIPIILYGKTKLNPRNINYRVFTAPVQKLIKNTSCDSRSSACKKQCN